jgi:hypothetical protein
LPVELDDEITLPFTLLVEAELTSISMMAFAGSGAVGSGVVPGAIPRP